MLLDSLNLVKNLHLRTAIVLRWHSLDEVENVYVAYNFILPSSYQNLLKLVEI